MRGIAAVRANVGPGRAVVRERGRFSVDPNEICGAAGVEAEALAAALRKVVRGEVRFDAGSRALYATDASNYRQVPIGVVMPRDGDDVVETVARLPPHSARRSWRAAAGTSLAGQCCNVAVVLDFSKYLNRILEIDPDARTRARRAGRRPRRPARRGRAARPHVRARSRDARRCTLGGMIGNNSCGVHSVMAGKTDDNVDELEVLAVRRHAAARSGATTRRRSSRAIVAEGGRRGEIYARLRDLARPLRAAHPRALSRRSRAASPATTSTDLLPENGFDVARALVGTEGTCVARPRGDGAARPEPAGARRSSSSATPTSSRPPTSAGDPRRTGRSGSRGSTTA